MKILIVQLARLGDLYQTWPVARALRRAHPSAEIHLLARPLFASAAEALDVIDRVIALPSRDLLSPLVADEPDVATALSGMSRFLAEVRSEAYDSVINLSFSPFSSFVADAAAATVSSCEVRGYTRHADGHLAIPDDASAYFYAQVGPGRSNRVHLTDLFALVAGVDLTLEDWRPPDGMRHTTSGQGQILLHISASDARKTLSPQKWAGVVRALLNSEGNPQVNSEVRAVSADAQLAIVGSGADVSIAEQIVASTRADRLTNLVGKTDAHKLVQLIASARLLIGGDSGPMQIASLTGTPAICLSFPSVSFWETGPRSVTSRIFEVQDENDIGSDAIAEEALRLLAGEPPLRPCTVSPGPTGTYVHSHAGESDDFNWRLLQAIYMGEPFPPSPDELFQLGCRRMQEANLFTREQLETLRTRPHDQTASAFLERADELMTTIGRFEPRVAALVRWLETERARVGPLPYARVVDAYDSLHAKFAAILDVYEPLTEGGLPGLNSHCEDPPPPSRFAKGDVSHGPR